MAVINIETWDSLISYGLGAYTIDITGNFYLSSIPSNLGNSPSATPSTGAHPWINLGTQLGIPKWNDATYFALDGYCQGSDGKTYKSLIPNNVGNDPTTSLTEWDLLNVQPVSTDFIMPDFASDAINQTDGGSPPKPAIAGPFGSMAKNTATNVYYTDDPQIIVDGPAWKEGGWNDATININGNRLGVLEQDMQGQGRAFSVATKNLTHKSLLPWNPTRIYQEGDFCTVGQNIMYSLQNDNQNNNPSLAITVPTAFWKNQPVPAQVENAVLSSGITNPEAESNPWVLTYDNVSNPTTITVPTIDECVFASNEPFTYKSFPQKVFSITIANMPAPPAPNCTAVYYLAYDINQDFEVFTNYQSKISATDIVVLGQFFVVWTAGVPSLAPPSAGLVNGGARTSPSISTTPWSQKVGFNQSSNVAISLNATSLTLLPSIVNFEGINFNGSRILANINTLNLGQQNPLNFRYISPLQLSTTTITPVVNTIDNINYYNGTAIVATPNGTATIQQIWQFTNGAGFLIQYGETVYSSLQIAVNNVEQATFTSIYDPEIVKPVGRLVMRTGPGTINLQDPTQATYFPVGISPYAGGNNVGTYLPLTGGSLTGDLSMGGNKITNLADGVDPTDAATVGQLPTLTAENFLANTPTFSYTNAQVNLYTRLFAFSVSGQEYSSFRVYLSTLQTGITGRDSAIILDVLYDANGFTITPQASNTSASIPTFYFKRNTLLEIEMWFRATSIQGNLIINASFISNTNSNAPPPTIDGITASGTPPTNLTQVNLNPDPFVSTTIYVDPVLMYFTDNGGLQTFTVTRPVGIPANAKKVYLSYVIDARGSNFDSTWVCNPGLTIGGGIPAVNARLAGGLAFQPGTNLSTTVGLFPAPFNIGQKLTSSQINSVLDSLAANFYVYAYE